MTKIFLHGTFNTYKQDILNFGINVMYTWPEDDRFLKTCTKKAEFIHNTQSMDNFDVRSSQSVSIINKFHIKFSELLAKWVSNQVSVRQGFWGTNTQYIKVMVIRGIGYRAFIIKNDFAYGGNNDIVGINRRNISFIASAYPEWNSDGETLCTDVEDNEHDTIRSWYDIAAIEFPYSRYLIIRAGHTNDLYIPLHPSILVKTSKRDRKLVIYGSSKLQVNTLARYIFDYRHPSVYTGRGIRRKHLKPIRKAGKRDKQKGRAF